MFEEESGRGGVPMRADPRAARFGGSKDAFENDATGEIEFLREHDDGPVVAGFHRDRILADGFEGIESAAVFLRRMREDGIVRHSRATHRFLAASFPGHQAMRA